DLLGRVGGDFFDVHTACGRGDEGDLALVSIQYETEIKLAGDLGTLLHEDLVDRQTFGPSLMRFQALTDHRFRSLRSRFGRIDVLHAAALAAPAGMSLRLYDPLASADPASSLRRFLGSRGNLARGDWDTVAREELFRLVFVEIHGRDGRL